MKDALFAARKRRITLLNAALKKLFPHPHIFLTFTTPWELLVAVQLSAQCTDKRVNEITKTLFKKYKTLDAYVHADPNVFAKDIHSAGYYNAKTKNILAAAKMLKSVYKGVLPHTMEELLQFPGVARKTANVVLNSAFGITEGIAVDTHVIRFVWRYDLSDYRDPIRIEKDLMALVPKKEWSSFTFRVIQYGRLIAPARVYDTVNDPLVKLYPPAGKRFRI